MHILIPYIAILIFSAGILAMIATRDTMADSGYSAAVAVMAGVLTYYMYRYM